jgi:cytidylate kinase
LVQKYQYVHNGNGVKEECALLFLGRILYAYFCRVMSPKSISIAIDGFSSCGKSTLARALAKKLNYKYLDTGAMYRAVTLFALNRGFFSQGVLLPDKLAQALTELSLHFEFNPETGKSDIFLNGRNVEKEIRGMEVAAKVSEVSAIRAVRRKMQEMQRMMGAAKSVVMDGRDIGTVVIPDAELKIYLTADPQIRIQRRLRELHGQGRSVSEKEVAENVKHRDYLDANREEDPLRQAEDARVLDNSNLSEEEQLELAYSWAMECINGNDSF